MNEVCNESTALVPLELGFVQKTESWKLTSQSFPSKAGGRPAWLALGAVPGHLRCQECDKPLSFLLQVYSPIEGQANCFHRSIFIFICRNGTCYQEGKTPTLKAFRSQLPRKNPYYNLNIIDELTFGDLSDGGHSNIKPSESVPELCAVCGCWGNLRCEQCRKVIYCCKEHKIIDLDTVHALHCGEIMSGKLLWSPLFNLSTNSTLFPEYELVMGPDPHSEYSEDEEKDDRNDEEDIQRDSDTGTDSVERKLEPMIVDPSQHQECEGDATSKLETQEVERRYHSNIAREPTQVLRYHRGGEPLWISAKHRLEEPPNCPLCGAKRQFEFQILPQLLNHLHLEFQGDSIDWGSLFIYTCSASCEIRYDHHSLDDESRASEYAEEFVWKQDIVD